MVHKNGTQNPDQSTSGRLKMKTGIFACPPFAFLNLQVEICIKQDFPSVLLTRN